MSARDFTLALIAVVALIALFPLTVRLFAKWLLPATTCPNCGSPVVHNDSFDDCMNEDCSWMRSVRGGR